MAETPENHSEGMLFTEFSLDDRGPAATLVDEAPVGFMRYSLQSIAQLADTLDLDFEDDGEGTAGAGADDAGKNDREKDIPAGDSGTADSAGKDSGAKNSGTGKQTKTTGKSAPAADYAIGPPTWEEFTNAFLKGAAVSPEQAEFIRRDAGGSPPVAAEPASAGDADELLGLDELDSLDDVDVLSILAAPARPDEPGSDGGRDGAERGYGVERVENWFEPPEEVAVQVMDGGSDAEPDDDPTGLFEKESPETAAVRSRSPDTAVDLFSDLDLDAAWNSKVDSHDGTLPFGASRSTTTSRERGERGSDTRYLDLFSDLDLNSLWDEKVHAHSSGEPDSPDGSGRPAFDAATLAGMSAEATVILDAGILRGHDLAPAASGADPGATTFMPSGNFFHSKTRAIPRADARKRSGEGKGTGPDAEAGEDRELDLLADLETFLDAGKAAAGRGRDGEAGGDYLPGDDGVGGVDTVVIAGSPDSFLEDDDYGEGEAEPARPEAAADQKGQKERKGRTEREGRGEENSARAGDEPAEPVRGGMAARAGFGEGGGQGRELGSEISDTAFYSFVNPDAGGGDPFADDAPAIPEDPLAGFDGLPDGGEDMARDDGEAGVGSLDRGGRPLTTDDLLNDLDFGDADVNADVSAPVIDNSDINMPSRRPRPGTEEMRALMGEGDFADAGAAGPEAGGAEGAPPDDGAPAADEVAVNPLDVFANMDDMDFSGDLDDDIKGMLEEDGDEGAAALNIDVDGFTGAEAAVPAAEPKGFAGRALRLAAGVLYRVIPRRHIEKIQAMIAWRDNWWFYCDLLAAIIASASLAVIISYYLWYRE